MYLKISDLNVSLGGMSILQNVNLHTNKGELVVVVGSNGAGKSTLVRTICGLNKCQSGIIEFEGKQIQNLEPYAVAAAGISRVPEGRQLFPAMTVRENLEIGAYNIRKDKKRVEENIEKVYTMFPVLKQYENRIASTFSGGEQQMLAVGRALMSDPKILLMDEMSLGLAPIVISEIFEKIKELNKSGMSILLIEQNARQALRIADRAYVIENGRNALEGTGQELLNNPQVKEAYLGL